MNLSTRFALLSCLVAATAVPSHAASLANDNAGNYGTTYAGQNNGTGFSAFTVTGGSNSGSFIGTSTGNGTGGSLGIDTAGKSFGLFANSGETATASRSFTAGGPSGAATLDPGQTFTLRLDNGNINTNSSVGFNLLNGAGVDRFTFQFIGGQPDYFYNLGNSNNIDTGVGFTPNGLTLALMVGVNNAFTFTITPNGGATTTINGTLVDSDITQFQVFNNNAGSGVANDAFFNNPAITGAVPEPSTTLVSAVGALGLGLCVWRVRRRTV